MTTLPYSDQELAALLQSATTIAVVGLSPKEGRPSNLVARYLQYQGYRIVPVNPGQSRILGERCYPELQEVPERIDIVNIFRRAEAVPPIVEQAIAAEAGAIWMQQGIISPEAAEMARGAGLRCIMDACIKIEHSRLFG